VSSTPPRIIELRWGSIDTDVGTFRDAKLWPGGGRNWDWNETGTRHRPGVQTADVAELLDHGIDTLVVGCGQHRRLGVTDELREHVEQCGVRLVVADTPGAIATYHRQIDEGRPVGAVLHSTC